MSLARCRGMTLIELMVATVIGIVGLLAMVSVFVTGTKAAKRISDTSYYEYEFYDVSRFILDDMRRAGYAIEGVREGSVRWSGATSNISLLSDNQCIAYAYEFQESGTEKVRYSSIYYQADKKVIRLYTLEKNIPVVAIEVPHITEACGLGSKRWGESITDNKSMSVTSLKFDGSTAPLYQVKLKARSMLIGRDDAMEFYVQAMN